MSATPKPVRKLIEKSKSTIEKSSIFHPKKMKQIASETAKSMKAAHKRKTTKEDLSKAQEHMEKHKG